jgi:fumarate hydratase class II
LSELNLGGTAIGTRLNTPDGYAELVVDILSEICEHPFRLAENLIEATSDTGVFISISSVLKRLATKMSKISNDLRLLSSGPRAGFGEINLPARQAGSSIMPGKVNPVIPEAVLMVCARVIGNDATVAWAGASGLFELNVAIPVMANANLESIRLLANSCVVLADKTIIGLEANLDRARAQAESSPAIVTPLNKYIGYEAAAKIAKHAVATGKTIRESVIELGYVDGEKLTMEQLDSALDVMSMTHP